MPLAVLGDGLEIGGGDGFLASMVAPHCRSLVTTDSYQERLAGGVSVRPANLRRLVCDAARLPFADFSFDFIFSSSVLEHIRDRALLHDELRRCLRPDGLILHVVPSRTWKLLQLLLYYPHNLVGGVDLLLDRIRSKLRRAGPSPARPRASTNRWSDSRRLTLRLVLENVLPRPHGEYSGHIAEWRGFGAKAWEQEFAAARFAVRRRILLPLYSGYGFGLERLRRLGERRGLSSHNAFVLTHAAATSPAFRWFERPAGIDAERG